MASEGSTAVVYRHAWCRHCDETYTVNPVALDGPQNKRIECPDCAKDIYASYHPAEYLGVVEEAGSGTEYAYADWLAGDAVVQFVHSRETSYLYVHRSPYAGGYATVEAAIEGPGTRHSAWKPGRFAIWLENGVPATLVSSDRLYEQHTAAERREAMA